MKHASLARRRGLAALAVLTLLTGVASAQGQAPKAAPPAPSPPQVVMPDAERIVLLIRTTLLTLNDALQSGNFTVLRDLAAPGFRDANSAARLGAIFSDLANRRVDLSAVAIMTPQLTGTPAIDPKTSMLRLKGTFPGQPVRIDFEVIYQAVGGRWRLFGLSVQPVTTATATAPAPDAKAKKADPPQK